jgi:hypothetical protein
MNGPAGGRRASRRPLRGLLSMTGMELSALPLLRLCEERKRRSNPCLRKRRDGLLRFARNDAVISDSNVKQREDAGLHSRDARRPSSTSVIALLNEQRAQGKPGAGCTHGSRAQKARGRTTGSTGNTPAFPARWFYGFLRALPGDRALLPPSLRGRIHGT